MPLLNGRTGLVTGEAPAWPRDGESGRRGRSPGNTAGVRSSRLKPRSLRERPARRSAARRTGAGYPRAVAQLALDALCRLRFG